MVCSHILGFPRMGAQRELKSALETYWKSASEPDDTNPDLEKLVEMGTVEGRSLGIAKEGRAGLGDGW